MLQSIRRKLKSEGAAGLLRSAARVVHPKKLSFYRDCLPLFEGKKGLETGGPSAIFGRRGLFPVYSVASAIDNCNFSSQTTWEGSISPGQTFIYDKHHSPGRQYIAEAGNLGCLQSGSYDFVLSSHMLEHTANPLLALTEYLRILKPGGALLLVLPHKDGTFDHRRPVTAIDHLRRDFEQHMAEDDLTHLPEILELHDLDRDSGISNFAEFKARSERNVENRCLHHHVFDTRLAVQMLDLMRLQIRAVESVRPYHIAMVAVKMGLEQQPDNGAFLSLEAYCLESSPFAGDRLSLAR